MKQAVIAMIAAVGILGSVEAATAQSPIKLRFAFTTAMDGPGGEAVKKMAEALKERAGNQIELEIFPRAQLGGESDMLAGIRSGSLDMGLFSTGLIASALEPRLQAVSLPFIWNSEDMFWKTLNAPAGRKLLDTLDSKGVKALSWGYWGPRGILANGFEINKPDDLKGRKIRAVQGAIYVKTLEALGANPVPLPPAELYAALQMHAVDGVDTARNFMVEMKFNEVTTSLAAIEIMMDSAVFAMNKQTFDNLKPELQQALVEAARIGGETMFKAYQKAGQIATATMEKGGLKITHPDPKAFEDKMKPVYDYFTPIVGADLIADLKAAQK